MRRSMMIASVMAFALAVAAFAQRTDNLQIRNRIEAVVMKWTDSLNRGNVQAAATLLAKDAIEITPLGKNTGAQIAENMEKVHKLGLTLTVRVDDVQLLPGGQWAIATGHYTGGFTNNPAASKVEGNYLWLLGSTGGDWKIRASSASRLAPSAPTR